MTKFNLTDYLLDVAERLIDLQHTDANNRFSRVSSVIGLEEYLSNMTFNTGWQLIAVDTRSGRFDDGSASDNLIDSQLYTFYLVKAIELHNFDARQQLIKDCEAIVKKILSKMFYDKREGLNGLLDLQRGSVSYDTIGPIGNNCHGLMVFFTVLDATNIAYDANDWLDGSES